MTRADWYCITFFFKNVDPGVVEILRTNQSLSIRKLFQNIARALVTAYPHVSLPPSKQKMDHIVEQIFAAAHGEVSVVVNCFQMGGRSISPRCGTRVVPASEASISGLTQDPVHFIACTHCGAVGVALGFAGDIKSHVSLQPGDPRAKLLSTIISETENNGSWGRPMQSPARVVGMINVHGAAKRSETKHRSCFNCSFFA